MLPYDYKDGAGTKQDSHRLYVADPNVPYTSKQAGKDASYIAIYSDNTFKFFGSGNLGLAWVSAMRARRKAEVNERP